MKRTQPSLLLLVPLALAPPVLAQTPADSRFAPLAESMIEMMNAMSSAMSRYGGQAAGQMGSGAPSLGGVVPSMPEWMPPPPAMPDPRSMFGGGDPTLNGSWIGQNGDLLIIRGNRFRLYTSREQFKDGQLRVEADRLFLGDPASGKGQRFEYAQSEGRLALRGADGSLLLFRKVSDQQKFGPNDPE